MQAIVALCHFCENHGPRIVMSTQPVRDLSAIDLPFCSPQSTNELFGEGPRFHSQSPGFMGGGMKPLAVDEDERCLACSSFGDGGIIRTTDFSSSVHYVSSQVPVSDRVYRLAKYACIRSLSGEVTGNSLSQPFQSPIKNVGAHLSQTMSINIGKEDSEEKRTSGTEADNDNVIVFGDMDHGYTLAYTFRLRDAKARGFQRWFSLILLSMDKLLITANYSFFVTAFSSIISQLKLQTDSVFRTEKFDLSAEFLQVAVSRASLLPVHFLRDKVTKIDLDTSRSMAFITGDSKIFFKLHRQMTWILRTQARLRSEKYLEGVPTQDMLVLIERESPNSGDLQLTADIANLTPHSFHLEHIAVLQCISRKLSELPLLNGRMSPLEAMLTQVVSGGQVLVGCVSAVYATKFLLALSYLIPLGCSIS
ncbi:hypothetical protein AB6A40_007848 [Gnathostoma spinigerum]|uniref:UDENN FLCN/SMCR8-type domain-containing protein n=1 Tax=Gnathostoma spinigerum TaxID=75299 RepID=A0ABD6EV53_9BILA